LVRFPKGLRKKSGIDWGGRTRKRGELLQKSGAGETWTGWRRGGTDQCAFPPKKDASAGVQGVKHETGKTPSLC